MDMNKAKNTIIVALVLLNGFLLIFNKVYYQNSKLSAQQLDNITQVYGQHNLLLSCDLPTNYEPVNMIAIESIGNISLEQVNTFFSGTEATSRSTLAGKTIYIQGQDTVTLMGNGVLFESAEGVGSFEDWQQAAIEKTVSQYVNGLGFGFKKMQLYQIDIQEQEGFLIFYEIYEGYPLFSNYVKVEVTQNGIMRVQLHRLIPTGFIGAKRYIYSADEAMLALMPFLLDAPDTPIVVEQVDFGFYVEKKDGEEEDLQEDDTLLNSQNAQPYYRVKVKGRKIPYWINAYTNEVKE